MFLFANKSHAQLTLTAANVTGGLTTGNLTYGQTDIMPIGTRLTASIGTVRLSGLTFTGTQTINSYFSNYRLARSSSNTYSAATSTVISGLTFTPSGTSLAVTGFVNEDITTANPVYYYLLIDYTAFGSTSNTFKFSLAASGISSNALNNNGSSGSATYSFTKPTVTIGGNNTTGSGAGANGITSGTLYYGQQDIVMFGFSVGVTNAPAIINSISIDATTTITNYFGQSTFRIFKTSGNNYTSGSPAPVSGASIAVSGTTINITGLGESMTAGQTNNYFIVADYNTVGSLSATEKFTLANGKITYNIGGTSTSTTTTGGTLQGNNFSMPAPTMTISGNNSTTTNGITPGNLIFGQNAVVLHGLSVTAANAPTTLNTLTFNASQTIANYFGGTTFKLYSTNNTNYSTGSPQLVSTATFALNNGQVTVSNIGETFAATAGTSVTKNYFLVADYSVNGTTGTTFKIDFNAINFVSGTGTSTTVSGSSAGNTFTIPAPSMSVTALNGVGNGNNGISTATIVKGQTDIVLYGFALTSANAPTSMSVLQLNSTQPVNSYFTNLRLVKSSTNNYSTGSLSTAATGSPNNNAINFTGMNEAFTTGGTNYYFLVADYTGTGTVPVTDVFNLNSLTYSTSASNTSTSVTGTPATGNTFTLAAPTITITGNNGVGGGANGISASNIYYGQTGIVMAGFSVAVTGAPTTLNSITLFASQTIGSYFGQPSFKLYRNTGTNYTTGTNTPITGAVFGLNGTTLTISNIGDAYTAGTTMNYFVVADYNQAGSVPATETFSYSANNANYTTAAGTSTTTTGTFTGNTFNMVAPNVLFTGINATSNGITSPTTLPYNTSNVVLYGFSLTDSQAPTTVNQINLSTNNPANDFFTNLKVYSSPTSTYDPATATLVTTVTPPAGNSAFNLTGLNEVLALNQTKYYFVVGDYNKVGNVLNVTPNYTTMKFDFSDMFQNVTNSTKTTSSTTGQTFSLQNPIVTISNYTTGLYSGTTVAAGNTYNLLGFNLSYTGPTNMHELNLDVTYPSGGDNFTSGYITSIDIIDPATGTRPSYITYVNNNGGNIAIGFDINSPQSGSKNYYLKVSFNSDWSVHKPTAFKICLNGQVTGNVCGNNSNCIVQNNYSNLTGSSCSSTYTGTTPAIPTVTTAAITNPATTSATVGGSITSVGYPNVTEYGVVYSTSATTPTITDSKLVIGNAASTATTFSNTLGSLTPGTTYYIRAYATNTTGTGYGAVVTYTPAVAAPSAAPVSRCGAGSVALSANGGTPAGGTYKWYTAATGGTAVATGANYSPIIVATTTYYVTYTVGTTESARTAVTATSNPVVVAPVSNAALSYSFSGDAKDVSGNQNDGNLLNAPTPVADRFGTPNAAYSFNGTNQWISSSKQIANPGPQTFTISMWFKTTTTSGGKLISFSDGLNVMAQGGYDRHLYMTNGGQLIFGVYNGATRTITSPLAYNDGNWHHVVVTFGNTAGMIMYVDNLSVITGPYYAPQSRAGYWKIGYDDLNGGWPSAPTSNYFNGTIDDVAVYNTELTASGVTALNDLNQIGTYTSSVCAGSPITIYAPPISGATYTWKDPTGATYVGTNGVFASAVPGTYTLTITGAPGSCSSPVNYTPNIVTVGGSAFTATSPVTVGSPSTITLTSTYDAASTYAWTFTGGTPATGTGQGPFAVTWSSAGTKTVSLTVTKGSCSSTTTANVVVNAVGPTVAPVTLCGASSTTLTATGASGSGTYNWYIDNTTTTALYTSTTNTYTPFIGGTTTLYVSFTSGSVTTARTAVTITVTPKAASSINSPMLSYPFESGSLTDWSGLANNGTLQGSTLPTMVADRNGLANGAYSFSGTNASPQYISTTTQYDPLIFSYSIWFKTTVAGGKLIGIGGKQTGENGSGINITHDRNLYMDNFGKLFYGVYGGSTVTINTPLAYNDGLWHHVIVTDGPVNGMCIYVDGGLKVSTPTYTVPQQIAEYWRIGGDGLQNWPNRPSNDFFNGVLDDVAIYNHELTAAEAASNDMNLYSFSAYCANNPLTVTAQSWPGSPTYGWVDNAKPSITGSGNPVTFTQATTTNYTLTTTTNGCTQNTAIVTPTMQTYTWTGAANTTAVGTDNNWTNTSTGIAGQAPKLDGTESIVIPANVPNVYPVLTAAKSVYTLNIASGAKLDLGGFALSVGCNIFNSGTLTKGTGANFNTSAVTWNGVSPITAQSLTGNNNTPVSTDLGNMTVSNTATNGAITLASGKIDLYNVLTLTSGKLVVSSPATVTLRSVATQTATVAAIPSGLSITGNLNVERYIAGGASKRGYRLLTSPVNNGSGVFSVNYLKNSAYVTGTTKTNGGFDLSPNANNPSIYFFRENTLVSNTTFSSGNYRGVNNISTDPNYSFDNETGTFQLPAGNGFLFFFRGDRGVADIATETVAGYVPTGTTFTTTGTLNTGNITVKNWYSQTTSLLYSSTSNTGSKTVTGFNLVANPYASTINIEKFNRQASQATSSIYGNNFPNESGTTLSSPLKIWVYNPTTKQYSTYEQKSTAITSADTISTQNPGISSDGYASNLIASGQGFFIRATAGNQTLTFRESAKTNYQPSSTITQAILSAPNRPVLASTSKFAAFAAMPTQQIAQAATSTTNEEGESLLRFRLIKDTVNTDAIVIGLRTDINPVYNGDKDAEDLGGNGALVSLSAMSSDSVKATIYRSPYPHKVQQVIPLYADATASGAYQLNLSDVSNLPALYEVWLKDSFTKDSVDIKANTLYNFNIDKGNAASFGTDRFRLILRQNPALGLRLVDFTASKVLTGAKTEWQVQNEANYTLFTVQRSTDNGKTWNNISVTKSSGLGTYSYTDPNPANGLNKYRLQLTDVNSDISLSKELPLMYSNTNNVSNNQVMVYPNPARENINVSIKQVNSSLNYNIQLTNSSGILLKNVNITQLYWQNNVSSLVPGTYVIKVVDNKSKNLLGIAKFVKL